MTIEIIKLLIAFILGVVVGRLSNKFLKGFGSNIIGYINGDSVGSVGASGNGSTTTLNIFRFLNHAGSTAYPTNGKIDDVAIFNRALSSTEITSLYNSQVKKFTGVSNI